MTGRTTDWLHKSNYTGLEDSVHEQIMGLQDSRCDKKYRVLINTANFCALSKKKNNQKKKPTKTRPKNGSEIDVKCQVTAPA